jgi:hypothetical protein
MGTIADMPTLCEDCSLEVSWADCDKRHDWCYQTECDNALGCGRISRDCEDRNGDS